MRNKTTNESALIKKFYKEFEKLSLDVKTFCKLCALTEVALTISKGNSTNVSEIIPDLNERISKNPKAFEEMKKLTLLIYSGTKYDESKSEFHYKIRDYLFIGKVSSKGLIFYYFCN